MTKEAIEKRIAELTNHRDRLLAELNQVEGAVSDCQYWITQLGGEQPPDSKEQV